MSEGRAVFDSASLGLLEEALLVLSQGFIDLPGVDQPDQRDRWRPILNALAERMQDNFPYQHPLYAGQMLKPPHPIARLAYSLALYINPNNHALDGGRASSALEKEVVAEIAHMFGWSTHLGHLTGGGTMANLEALWVARALAPDRVLLASSQAHYTHARLSSVLKVPFRSVPVDEQGRMNLESLERELERGDVGTVVVTLGTTALGAVDPLPEILELQARHGFRIHVDAAYGGYFKLLDELDPASHRAFELIGRADSIVVDPHKHGLQPYGCGCVLFRDPSVGRFYQHDSPYTYFSSDELHLGEISLECSRPGAAAAALWATTRLMPLVKDGEMASGLLASRRAALELWTALAASARFVPLMRPALDIVVFALRADRATEASTRARACFEDAARRGLHLALAEIPRSIVQPSGAVAEFDQETVTCLRACVMKPEHLDWLPEILSRLDATA